MGKLQTGYYTKGKRNLGKKRGTEFGIFAEMYGSGERIERVLIFLAVENIA